MLVRVYVGGWCSYVGALLLIGGACACSSGSVDASADAGSRDAAPVPLLDSSVDAGATLDAALAPENDVASSDSSGTLDSATDADLACAWDGSYESPACSACLIVRCCGAVATCEGDTACVALDVCVNECAATGGGDAGSVSTCAQICADGQTLDVRAEWKALSDCVELSCGNQGAGPCE
jgi:hypothetical protein